MHIGLQLGTIEFTAGFGREIIPAVADL